MKNRKRLFYDIETSQMIFKGWSTGKQFVGAHQILEHSKIISIHWKWEGEDEEVHNLDWGINKQCDKSLIKKFIKELNKADEIVAHNGDRFDIKWIRARAVFNGLEMRNHYNMIDTYKISKANLRIPSHSLKELCKYYGLAAKVDAGGIDTWDKIQFEKDQEALDHLLYYGDGDIISLEAVYNKLRPYAKHKVNYAVLHGNTKFHCPECSHLGRWNKTYTTAAGTSQILMLCRNTACKTYFKVNNKTYQDYLQFRMINGVDQQ